MTKKYVLDRKNCQFLGILLTSIGLASILAWHYEVPSPIATPLRPKHDKKTISYEVVFADDALLTKDGTIKEVGETFANAKGWRQADITFSKTNQRPDLVIRFDTPAEIAASSLICSAEYNCQIENQILVNATLWQHGDGWNGSTVDYHSLIINHETGHFLGLGHWHCACWLMPAPVMLSHQNVTSFHIWKPNPWPTAEEIEAVRKNVID